MTTLIALFTILISIVGAQDARALEPSREVVQQRVTLAMSYPIGLRNFIWISQPPGAFDICWITSHSFQWDVFLHFNNHSCYQLADAMLVMSPGDIGRFDTAVSELEIENGNDGNCYFRKRNPHKDLEIIAFEPCPNLAPRILGVQF